MREIKFRVWDKTSRGMLGAYDVFSIGNYSYIKDDIELMQFAGIHDKNGKEIYEGDILKDYGEVVWVEWNASFRVNPFGNNDISFMESFANIDDAEIIGNIYENSDLLKP